MSRAGRPSMRKLAAIDPDNGVVIVDNPRFPKKHGRLVPCHDGTPMIDFLCSGCGAANHLHESQIADAPAHVTEIGARCSGCRKPLIVARAVLEEGFRQSALAQEPTQ
jgi:hypothetical protein